MKPHDLRRAIIERKKITDYLLNPEHLGNGGKAAFFHNIGFTQENWTDLASALQKSAETAETTKTMKSPHGRKYIQNRFIESMDGRTRKIRMIWIVDSQEALPRLVTAYPGE